MRLVLVLVFGVLAGCSVADRYHGLFFSAPGNHGPPFVLQQEDCRSCHGDDLAGGVLVEDDPTSTEVGCDDCHDAGWRTDCTFCHGGDDNETGAPPRDLDRQAPPAFDVHSAHVDDSVHAAWECSQCHVQPTDVMNPGHAIDDTPGVAEVSFVAGQAPDTVWDGVGCSNNACHGNGVDNGEVAVADAPLDCNGCHPGPESTPDDQAALSGDHRAHAQHGNVCADCHGNIDPSGTFVDPATHVDLQPTVQMPDTITVDSGHCTGRCHEFDHASFSW